MMMIEIIQILLNKPIVVSISDVKIIDDDGIIRNLLTSSRKMFCNIRLNFVLSTDHWLCVYNITKYQLHFIHRYFMNQVQSSSNAMAVVKKLKKIDGNKIYTFDKDVLSVVRFHAESFQVTATTEIIAALTNSTSLNIIEIENYNINNENVNILATVLHHNPQLQELHLNKNELQTNNTIKIIKALQNAVTLTKLSLCYNNITHEAANDIAATLSYNTKLKEVDFSGNDLRTKGVIKIATALQSMATLTKLNMSNNKIPYTAADDIAAAITCNIYLQEFDIGTNNLQASGASKIAGGLQKISTLTKLCIANNNISFEAAGDIAAAITSNTHLQEFDIGSNNIQTLGITRIAKGLQKLSTLRKLYMNDNNITDEAADDITATISCNTQLEELDVSGNYLRTEYVIEIAVALESVVTLTKLNMSNNNITYIAANAIAVAITRNTRNTHLQEFIISGNCLELLGAAMIARYLQRVSTLTKLYIANNNIKCIANNNIKYNRYISDSATDDIAAAITCNIHLQEFDIGTNNLQALGAAKIARGLQKISTLTKLCIANNNIGDEAADDIAAAVSCNIHLQEFDIGRNDLRASGIATIAKGLQKNSMLIKLYLNNNKISCEAADDIAAVVSSNAIQVLDVSDNYLGTRGITKVAKALQSVCTLTNLYIRNTGMTDRATDDIAAAISCNPYLEEFDIGKNVIQGRGALKLAKSFQQISTLKKLFMDNNMITDEASDDITAIIKCNRHLNEFRINKNMLTQLKSIRAACATKPSLLIFI